MDSWQRSAFSPAEMWLLLEGKIALTEVEIQKSEQGDK